MKDTKYQHKANSNLVLQGQNKDGSERGPRGAGQDLPSGEGESLTGQQLARFGDKVVRSRPNQDQSSAILGNGMDGKGDAENKQSLTSTRQ